MRKYMAVLSLSMLAGCSTAPVKPISPAISEPMTVHFIALEVDNEVSSFILISNTGKTVILDADDCDDDCLSTLKRLTDSGDFDTLDIETKQANET